MKVLHIICLFFSSLLILNGLESFSQQADFTLVPHPGAGGTWVFTQDRKVICGLEVLPDETGGGTEVLLKIPMMHNEKL